MTREHKLSLVLGFGLLLFVGILLSDHFSAAQRREHADLATATPDRNSSRALTDSISLQPLPAAVRVATSTVGQYSSDGVQPSDQGMQPYGGTAPVAPAPLAVPAELYAIKAGESLYKICQTKYGDGSLWKSLAEFNSNVIPNPTKLRAGVTIRLPSKSVLRGEVPHSAALPQAQFDGAIGGSADMQPLAPTQQAEPAAPVTREYTVQRGDTLSTIASKKLGSKSKWKQIADANRDRLNDPHGLVPGTVIRLPN
jgi:nucleoid-associated protein YgaU